MKTVGILGGMGPEATILLMQKVLAAVPARDDADHVPLLVHQNPQVPSRIRALIQGGGEDPGPVLAHMARDLEAGGAQALAMPATPHEPMGQLPFQQLSFAEPANDSGHDSFEASVAKAMEGLADEESSH